MQCLHSKGASDMLIQLINCLSRKDVSLSFIGCEIDSGGEKSVADMSASSSFMHTLSPALGAIYSSSNGSNSLSNFANICSDVRD